MRYRRPLLIVVAVVAAVMALLLSPVQQHWRTQSPDGAFAAVARSQPIRSLIPILPGGGSDKPGRVTVYRGDQPCGSAAVPMVSYVYDVRWELDAKPRRAELRLIATWNLDACTVEVLR